LFQTEQGYFEIEPAGRNDAHDTTPTVYIGDRVAIIETHTNAVILRPLKEGCYNLIGNAHVRYLDNPDYFPDGNQAEFDLEPIRVR
jgi:hypothetical protein